MGSRTSSEPDAYVEKLADHARRLQREARDAIACGDYARASALIRDAELLADDVHGLVVDFEQRQADRMMGHAAARAEAEAGAKAHRARLPLRRAGLGLAIGASLAMGFALIEF